MCTFSSMINDEKILTFKTVDFQSIPFKIICLISLPSFKVSGPFVETSCVF